MICFSGPTSDITVEDNGIRLTNYSFQNVGADLSLKPVMQFYYDANKKKHVIFDEDANLIWPGETSVRPSDIPEPKPIECTYLLHILNQKNLSVIKMDILAQWHKRRQIKLLNF